MMNVVWLTRYISGLFALMAIASLAVTYHPSVEYLNIAMPVNFGFVALVAFGISQILGELPAEHWVHRSARLQYGLTLLAVMVTLVASMSS